MGVDFQSKKNMETESLGQGEKDCAEIDVSASLRKSWIGEDVALSKLFGLNMATDISRSAFYPSS